MPPNEAPVTAVYRQQEEDQNGLATAPVTKVAPVPVDQIRVEDKLYSTEKLAELHPGGPIFIRVRSQDKLKGDGLVDLQCMLVRPY